MIKIYLFLILTCFWKKPSYSLKEEEKSWADMESRFLQHRHQNENRIGRQGPKVWNKWSEWSTCSVTCGAGKLIRWRHCIAGSCTLGEKQAQLKTCTYPSCLNEVGKPKIWDRWGKWSCCSTSCGPGKITRWRHCVAGGCAPGEKEAQLKPCCLRKCHEKT